MQPAEETHLTPIDALKEHLKPIQPEDPMSEAVRKALLVDFIDMLSNEAGSRIGDDIEHVHDMRVATRRMRSVLQLLEGYFKGKTAEYYRRGLRKIARALGGVRDLDVMIDNLEKFLANTDEAHRPALQGVIGLLDDRRQVARQHLIAVLDKNDYQAFIEEFKTFLLTPGAGTRSIDANGLTPTEVRHVLPIEVYEHLAAIRVYDHIIETADNETLHGLRIEFKKLRYLLSMFTDLLGASGKDFIKELKAIQDHLGEMNDAVVAHSMLGDLLPKLDEDGAVAVQAYLAHLDEKGSALKEKVPDVWRRFNTRTVQRLLANSVAGL